MSYVLYAYPMNNLALMEQSVVELVKQYRDTGHLDPEQADWLDYAETALLERPMNVPQNTA